VLGAAGRKKTTAQPLGEQASSGNNSGEINWQHTAGIWRFGETFGISAALYPLRSPPCIHNVFALVNPSGGSQTMNMHATTTARNKFIADSGYGEEDYLVHLAAGSKQSFPA
jgi:hypothetical protein